MFAYSDDAGYLRSKVLLLGVLRESAEGFLYAKYWVIHREGPGNHGPLKSLY
jgi:hypothetical protein